MIHLNVGKPIAQRVKAQPMWTTRELSAKVASNERRITNLFKEYPAPAHKKEPNAVRYGLHDFMKWWKSLPQEARDYAVATDKTQRALRKAKRDSNSDFIADTFS